MSTETLAPRVRLFIFEHFLEHAAPPVVEQVMGTFAISRAEATDVLRELETARHIALVPGTDRILMAFPFSAIATPFQATVRGRSYFANCAWDAIAFHSMLGEETRVDSSCHHCAAPIQIELKDGRATLVDPGASLTAEQVHALSGPIYAGKFALDYARPTKEALLDQWAAMGLTGDYWKL